VRKRESKDDRERGREMRKDSEKWESTVEK
jgi:hypothetical protein